MTYREKMEEYEELDAQIEVLNSKVKSIRADLKAQEREVQGLEEAMLKEKYDVDELKGMSFSGFLAKLKGQLEEKKEKEYREYMQAKWDYDEAVQRTVFYREDMERLIAGIRELEQKKEELETFLVLHFPEAREMQKACDEKRQGLFAWKKELEEAYSAVSETMNLADRALGEFNSADGWALFDVMGGGFFADMCKYEAIDAAQSMVNEMKACARRMDKELLDVDIRFREELAEISEGTQGLDLFLDNIFTDLSVKETIQENMEKLESYRVSLAEVRKRLSDQIAKTEKELEECRFGG